MIGTNSIRPKLHKSEVALTDLENNNNISSYIKGLLEQKKDEVEEKFNFSGQAPSSPDSEVQIINYTIDADHNGAMVLIEGGYHQKETQKYQLILFMTLLKAPLITKKHVKNYQRRGYPVYTYDMRGHGRNGSIRTGDASFEAYINDLLQITNWIRYKTNRKKTCN